MSFGFIFSPGVLLGKGKITFGTSPELIKFYTKWEVGREIQGTILATQTVEMEGVNDRVISYFAFRDITVSSFSVFLESESMGSIQGIGMIDPPILSWKIHTPSSEGFEIYRLQDNGEYNLHAEYASTDQYRTIIDGVIWKKTT